MSQKTSISIVIPAYNAAQFIEDAVKSCFNQTYRPLEVFVVNDGSTDATAARVEALEGSLSSDTFQLKLLDIGQNKGAANALNVGFSQSQSEYICWLSADDMFIDEDKIGKQAAQMRKTEAGWSYFKEYYTGSTLSTARLVKCSYLPRMRILDPVFIRNPEIRMALLLFINPVNGSSIMIKKTAIEQFGQFDPATRNVDGDGDLWMRFTALQLKLQVLKGSTVFYRVHGMQTSKRKDQMIYGCELTRIRILRALEKSGRLERTISSMAFFLPVILLAKKHYERPLVSEFLFDYIISHRKRFNWFLFRTAKKSLNDVRKHRNYLAIDKENFARDIENLRKSDEFKRFEERLQGIM
jgi:glycosyltransferase involved in cell wall biosynthesis